MAAVYALEAFFDLLKAAVETTWLTTDAKGATVKRVVVEWGQTRVPANLNYGTIGRVLVVPGGADGAVGEFGGVKHWPQPAKPLLNLGHKFSIYCYGHSGSECHQKDRDHDHVAFKVLHEVVRQAWNVSHHWDAETSPVIVGEPRIVKPLGQRQLGREYILPCVIEQPILDMFDDDLPGSDVAPGAADITDTLGNVSEESTTTEI